MQQGVKHRLIAFFSCCLLFFLTAKANPNDTLYCIPDTSIWGQRITTTELHASEFVLVFWASWDEPSRRLLKQLDDLAEEVNTHPRNYKSIRIIAVSLDAREVQLRKMLLTDRIQNASVFCDFKGWDGAFVKQFHPNIIPYARWYRTSGIFQKTNPDIDEIRAALKKASKLP